MNTILNQMLKKYDIKNIQDETNAMKEIIENIGDSFDINTIRELLNEKFKEIDYKIAKEDVMPFIEDKKSIDIWNEEFFIEITKELH